MASKLETTKFTKLIYGKMAGVRVCVLVPTLRLKGACLSIFEQTNQSRLISTCS